MTHRTARLIRVFRSPGDRSRGRVICGAASWPCALGRSGTTRSKREGDGGTPAARLRPLAVWYRGDRVRRPGTPMPTHRIQPTIGWCDDPGSRLYNRPIRLPSGRSHESMWREDHLYDVVVDLSWNRSPRRAGRGSAIFLHAARAGLTPTEGCIALAPRDLRRLVERLGRRSIVVVGG